MKLRQLTLIGFLLGLGLFSYGGVSQLRRAWSSLLKADPSIEYPERLDVKDSRIGDVAVIHFVITNQGRKELLIDEIRSNCSCTGIEREESGRYVRPDSIRVKGGEQANLVMRVAVRGVAVGAVMNNLVQFRTNDPTRPQCAIQVPVRCVSGGISANPEFVAFGAVPIGEKPRQIVEIWDNALTPRVIEQITSSSPERIAVRLLPIESQAPESQKNGKGSLIGQLEVTVDTRAAGEISEAVRVHFMDPNEPPSLLSVRGRIVAPIEVSPSILVLPRASANGPIYSAKCVCRSHTGQPLTVTVGSLPPCLSADVSDDGTGSVRIVRITWDPLGAKPSLEGQRYVLLLQAKSGEWEEILSLPVVLHD